MTLFQTIKQSNTESLHNIKEYNTIESCVCTDTCMISVLNSDLFVVNLLPFGPGPPAGPSGPSGPTSPGAPLGPVGPFPPAGPIGPKNK